MKHYEGEGADGATGNSTNCQKLFTQYGFQLDRVGTDWVPQENLFNGKDVVVFVMINAMIN